jgi:hypothetical protein
MVFQGYRTKLVWVVVVMFTTTQLILLPFIYFHPEQKTTADFLMWFIPWFCALIFSLFFLGSWLWSRKHKKKQSQSVEVINKTSSDTNFLTTMTSEQIRAFFDSLAKMKPNQITATLDSLLKTTKEVRKE